VHYNYKMENIDKDGYWLDCHFLSGACDSYVNSMNHFKYSEITAQSGDFGFAVSHLVLGSEEIIKSLILICLHGNRYFIENNEKEKIFKNHNFKHFNIKEFLKSLTADLQEDFELNFLRYTVYPESCKNKYQSTAIFLSKTLKLGLIGDKEIKDLVELMDSANDFKNKGFYVDYDTDWLTPSDITKEIYQRYKELTIKLMKFIEPIFVMPLTDERIMDFLYD